MGRYSIIVFHWYKIMSSKNLFLTSGIFVFIWSSGFIVGRLIVGSVSPNIFLGIRFFCTAILFAFIAYILKKTYPKYTEIPKHIIIGILCNGIYLGGSYWAINNGMPAGIMALLGGLQPLFTLIFASLFFAEPFRINYTFCITLGLLGIYLSLPLSINNNYNFLVILISILSIISITLGLLFQKHYTQSSELIPSLVIQNISGAFISLLLVIFLQEKTVILGFNFWFSLFWAVIVLSGLGIYLLMKLAQNNNAVKVTSLMLLCPPLAAIQANLLFKEQLTLLQICGFFLALLGVALCQKVKT